MLHRHIIDLPPQVVTARFKSLDEWKELSKAALDTFTSMVVDIGDLQEGQMRLLASGSMSYIYVIQTALRHIQNRIDTTADQTLLASSEILTTAIRRCALHRGIVEDPIQLRAT